MLVRFIADLFYNVPVTELYQVFDVFERVAFIVSGGQKPPSITEILLAGATAFVASALVVVVHAIYDAYFSGKSTSEEIDDTQTSKTEQKAPVEPQSGDPTYIARETTRYRRQRPWQE